MALFEKRLLLVLVAASLLLFGCYSAPQPSTGEPNKTNVSVPPVGPPANQTNLTPAVKISKSEVELRMAMRKLWEDHITWTRVYIISAAEGYNDTDQAAARLLKNQEDIGNAIKPYYGEAAGNSLTALLKEHILGAVALLDAAKKGNASGVADAERNWYKNADEITELLSGANPNWKKEDLREMMYEHLNLTEKEAVDRLNGDYSADVADYDAIHDEILGMSDALSGGIVKQFPEKFADKSGGMTESELSLRLAERKLWEDHVTWTRMYIISVAGNGKDAGPTTARLLKNQEDIGNAIKPVYGDSAGSNLTALLKEHILGAAALLDAAKKGNATAAADAETGWYRNADEIAAFLGAANPNWPEDDMKGMLHEHLKNTKAEAVARLTGDYAGDVAAYDIVHSQGLMMADGLSGGIVKQFPEKFSK